MKAVAISRIGISLDFPAAQLQDNFRGKAGAFDAVLAGISNAREAGIEIQINCTVTRRNVAYLERLLSLALDVGAVAFHPFLLVPTGRGKGLESVELSPEEYERTLNWIYDKQLELGERIFFKPTDAPHYLRIVAQRRKTAPIHAAPACHCALPQRGATRPMPSPAVAWPAPAFASSPTRGKSKAVVIWTWRRRRQDGIVQPDLVWFPLVQPVAGPVGNQRKVRRLRIQKDLRRVPGSRL